MNRIEAKFYTKLLEKLEPYTYTREEILDKHLAKAVSFFVTETGLKVILKDLLQADRKLKEFNRYNGREH